MPALTHDSLRIGGDWKELQKISLALAFMGDTSAVNRMLNLATLNAARTFVPKLKAEAPNAGGGQGYATGRIKKAIKARRAKYNWPGAVVGIKAGESRSDKSGAWYRWLYTSPSRAHRITPRKAGGRLKTQYGYASSVEHPGWSGNNFVDRVTDQNPANLEAAMNAFHNSVASAYNDGPLRKTVLRYKRRA